ncbi:hypothetical protein CCY99_05770 [Helicobacter sp. 16-1353]|uniref:3'-5' exonuclease n=1 Tax=Helicobacter sp. 16-1353 TaxID=2004996 RepID=UPI000DCE0F33|nr:3'-5' exonuclease [Helicobacter sp. 16-1353]RAX53912.1 hypothetical protein CCY99_05770 [Helicobacter sp. 16-1353]
MQNNLDNYENLIEILKEKDSIALDEFMEILDNEYNIDINIEIAKSLGIPLFINGDEISLKTRDSIFNSLFCIVDIETTGFSPQENDIIEIGAIKYKNGNIIDRFESYAFTKEIPDKITEITGIDGSMIANAPKINKVLERFKIFLEDSVFMAHNITFDFNFINEKLSQNKIPIMKNRTICTLQLARKTIQAPKYGLGYLNEFLNIDYPVRHRAFADCIIALKVFEYSLLNLSNEILSVEDLITFTKNKKS